MKTPASPSPLRAALSAWTTPVKASLLAASLGLTVMQSLNAAVIPYTNDFSGTGSNVAFPNQTVSAGSSWTVTGGSYVYSSTNTSYPVGNASIPLTNMGTSPFTVETQFSVSSLGAFNANGITVGFGLFGADPAFSGTGTSGGNAYYLADWTLATSSTSVTPGLFRLLSQGDATGYTSTSTVIDTNPDSSIAITLGATYTMRLEGSYSGSTLNMTFSLLNSTGTVLGAITASDTSPLAGTYFGYRNRAGIQGGSFSTSFDSYSVTAVPEPATVVLLGLSAGAILMIRRRTNA